MKEPGIWLSRKEWQVIRSLLHATTNECGHVTIQPRVNVMYGLDSAEGRRLMGKLRMRGSERISLTESEFVERYQDLDLCERPHVARTCTCGHDYEDHDGGMGSEWCHGQGTWTMGGNPPEERCQCRKFVEAPREAP